MLPTDTSGGVGGGDFFKFETGQNKIAILDEVVTGYEYWTNQNVCVRSKEKFEETPDIKIRQVKNQKTGETEDKADTQKFWWAMPVYNYKTKSVELAQFNQKAIKTGLANLQNNEDWGNPIGEYSITITREGEGLTTKYTMTPNPANDKSKKEIADIVEEYKANPMDVEGVMFK